MKKIRTELQEPTAKDFETTIKSLNEMRGLLCQKGN